jgi:hypothetical protein
MNKEGRGFNPAVADASNYSPVLRPAQSRACGTPRGARRTEVSKPFCGGVNPPFRSPDSKRQSVVRNPG